MSVTPQIIPDKNTCFILVGLPGSGKSTWVANNLGLKNSVICSADHFFMNADGEYIFNKDNLYRAHKMCFNKAVNAMVTGQKIVVIDNTNIRTRDRNVYIKLAKQYGYHVCFVVFSAENYSNKELVSRNLHGVDEETINRMRAAFTYPLVLDDQTLIMAS